MKRQSILVWIVVMTAITSVYSADWQVDWIRGSDYPPCTPIWRIYPLYCPPSSHPPGTIPFSGPTGVFSNGCYAEVNYGGTPTITINPSQKTIELWFKPPAPGFCLEVYNPVCGLNGWFGPLSGGDWVFYSHEIPFPYGPFSINFHVDGPHPTLTILNPDGGERLLGGSTYTIRWEDSRCANCGGNYLLDYSIDDGNNWIPVDSNPVSNTCSYDWLVPSIFSNRALIRITDADVQNISDTSDDSFLIYLCLLEISGDWNSDCYIDFDDFSIIAAGWNVDGGTDINDLAAFVQYWLDCVNPYDPRCYDFGEARNPNPADGAVDVSVDTNLAWTRGLYAAQEEVYFGTDPCALPKVTTILNFQDPEYDPGDPNIGASTTYYWQVISTDFNGTPHPGAVWSFTTVSGVAMPNSPDDGAVIPGSEYAGNIYTWLDFIPGATMVDFRGYCSDNYDEVLNRVQDANLGPPPYPTMPNRYYVGLPVVMPYVESLERGVRYYWAVDSYDAKGNVFSSDIWEFTIQDVKATLPKPPNEATFVETDVLLSWLPGYGPPPALHPSTLLEHDVYLGTSWEDVYNANWHAPEFLDTVSEPNIAVTGLEFNTTYYWRVDEVWGRGPPPSSPYYYKGDVWKFTTAPLVP